MAYLDCAAHSPLDPNVLSFLQSSAENEWGNPHNIGHFAGRVAADAVEVARRQVGELFGATPENVTFTSGATEANNLAIFGFASASHDNFRVVTTAAEHVSVLAPCREIASRNNSHASFVRIDALGQIVWEELEAELNDGANLLSVLWVNNETGTQQPIERLHDLARHYECKLHVDAAQAVGRVETRALWKYADFISVSAHKFGGPTGIGAFIGDPIHLRPLMFGGNQQPLRSGTVPTKLAMAMGLACDQRANCFEQEHHRLRRMTSRIRSRLQDHGRVLSPEDAAPGIVSHSFEGLESDTIQALMEDVAVSSGAACAAGALDSSHVLRAMGVKNSVAFSTIRISINAQTTEDELERGLDRIIETVTALRTGNPQVCFS